MRDTVRALAARCPVCVVSGRDRTVVQTFLGIDGLVVAGSYGFDIAGPDGTVLRDVGAGVEDLVAEVHDQVGAALAAVPGVVVEAKRASVAVHYRLTAPADRARVRAVVDVVLALHPGRLRVTRERWSTSCNPRSSGGKGRAVLYLLTTLPRRRSREGNGDVAARRAQCDHVVDRGACEHQPPGRPAAALLGLQKTGALEPGYRADLLVLDSRLDVVKVMRAGRWSTPAVEAHEPPITNEHARSRMARSRLTATAIVRLDDAGRSTLPPGQLTQHARRMIQTVTRPGRNDDTLSAPWRGFRGDLWRDSIDTRQFLQDNYTPYEGDASFLTGPTARMTGIWARMSALFPQERQRGVYGVDPHTLALITAHAPGYIDRDNELIVGLQTDAPLKCAIMPFGGWHVVETSLQTYGYAVDPQVTEIFTKYRKTHNDGGFDAYTAEILAARHSHIITGLPDAYGRGRIIGDDRRVALYGTDRLVADKKLVKYSLDALASSADVIRDREELAEQVRTLGKLREMPPPTASTSLGLLPPRSRRSSGSTSATWRR